MKKNSGIIYNNVYILKLVYEASHSRIPLSILFEILRAFSNFIFEVFLLQYIINAIQQQLTFLHIVGCVLLALAFQVFFITFKAWYTEVFLPNNNVIIQQSIQKKIFDKSSKVEVACYENPDFYDKYVKSVNEANNRVEEVISTLSDLVYAIFSVITVSVAFIFINPFLIVFAVLPLIFNLIVGKKINKINYEYNIELQEKSRKKDYVKRTFYLPDYAKEMRLTNINRVLLKKLKTVIYEIILMIKDRKPLIAIFDYIYAIIDNVIVYLGAISFSVYQTLVAKTMLIGDCFVVINSISNLAWSLNQFSKIIMRFHDHSLYIENLRNFLEYEPQITSGSKKLTDNRDLEFCNVSFSYNSKPILNNISFKIKNGEKIALVGENGAGKSTLIKLLLRLYDPQSGDITMGENNIKNYNLDEYRSRFGVVFQDFKLFAMTVSENLLFSKTITNEKKKKLELALRQSGLGDKFQKHSIDTQITKEFDETGMILSSGETQKLAIARIFANDYDIIILDEPTSALDPIAEANMYEVMLDACKEKTVIFISHRMSSAVLADRIFFLENGSIIENGTHEELISKNGKYKYLWDLQANSYKEVTHEKSYIK